MFGFLKIVAESFFSRIGEKLFECVESFMDNNSTFQALKRKFGSLSIESSGVEEEIDNAELPSKKKIKREVENSGMEVPTTRMLGKGFEDCLERICNSLREDSVKSIGIYGMGGVGKTILVTHLNNKLVKENQKCVYLVTVSRDCNIRMLQDKIAHDMGIDLSNEFDENKRAARLKIKLSSLGKNIVLILDDVWENIRLEKVGDPLRVHGCRLIITTRSLKVCREIGCQQEISVNTLDTDESWNLFSEKFGQEITTHSPDVKTIAKSMAELCDGLPLGIITLAGSMRGETDIRVWRNAMNELSVWKHDDMEDKVFKVLKYTFDRLDPKHQTRGENNKEYTKLQCCFLYCCLYPEDWKINRNALVRKFISEELVDKTMGWGAQVDEGHTILNKLLNVCLLESAKDYRGVDCVKMHDLVRAMALKITQEKYTVLACCLLKQIPKEEEYWMKEKMSLMKNEIKEIPNGISPNCPNLTTLLLQKNFSLKFISDSFFSQMHGICVLDLSDNGEITTLPNSLSNLESMKSLLLGGCRKLVYVPYLGRLKALKGLNLSNTAIKEVPQGMDNLLNLNFLSLDSRYLKDLPKGLLLKFPYLQCLHLPYHILAPIDEIESLEKLEEFKGRVDAIYDFNRFIRSRQQSQSRYIKIAIEVSKFSFLRDPDNFVENNNNKVILVRCHLIQENMPIMLPDNIRCLRIRVCEGLSKCLLDDFPKFNNPKSLNTLSINGCEGIECIMEKQEIGAGVGVALPIPAQDVFSSLTKLDIWCCFEMKKLGLTGSELPNIEELRLSTCFEIEEIIEQGDGETDVVSFPKLRRLYLRDLPRLKSICKARMKCDSIEKIEIRECPELKRIPLYFRKEREVMEISFITSYSPPPALKIIEIELDELEWWDSVEWEHPDHKGLLQPFLRYI